MVIFTAKLSKGKLISIVAAAAALLLLIIFLANRPSGKDIAETAGKKLESPESRVEFLASLGYTVSSEPVRTQEVQIPKEFTEVYEQYNAVQKSQGYDLEKFQGKNVMQYVYLVENYPENSGETASPGEPVYATLLLYKNKLIGGDLSRSGQQGFLRPLTAA